MQVDIFNFKDYRKYLNTVFSNEYKALYGNKSKLAKYLNCQTSYISQVCTFRSHLNLEHGFKVCSFLKLDEPQSEYFLILIQSDRAGTVELKDYFDEKRKEILKTRELIKERINVKDEPSHHDQVLYYSNWVYSAIHIACALPCIRNVQDLEDYLGIPKNIINPATNFLLKAGLITYSKKNEFNIGKNRIHIGENSQFINNHHTNWRLQALRQLDHRDKNDLCYSGILAISKEDAKKIKQNILEALERSEKIIQDSPEEELYSILIDLSRFKKSIF